VQCLIIFASVACTYEIQKYEMIALKIASKIILRINLNKVMYVLYTGNYKKKIVLK